MTSDAKLAESIPSDASQDNPVTDCLRHTSQQILSGDFAAARKCLDQTQSKLEPMEQERLAAARSSLKLDPAAIAVVLTCLAGIATIGILTLIHAGG